MGNAAIRKIPEDLTKCTEAQLRCMINSVIINNPWNEDDDQSEEDSLLETIQIMKEKGFRPITPSEYVMELKRQRKDDVNAKLGIKVWLPIERSHSAYDSEEKEYMADATPKGAKDMFTKSGGSNAPIYNSSCSLSLRFTDSKDSAASHSDGGSSLPSGSPHLTSLCLPLSREDAASEVIKSGSSAAVLSEMEDSEDNIATEEWPMHGVKQGFRGHYQQGHAQCMHVAGWVRSPQQTTSMSATPGSHSVFCAILACSEALLTNGMEEMVAERRKQTGTMYTSKYLCELSCALVLAQSQDLMTNIQNLMKRYGCTENMPELLDKSSCVAYREASSATFSFCHECSGEHGRMLCTTQGVGRGHILLRETPFAVVMATSCGCKEGPLLVEHAMLAAAAMRRRHRSHARDLERLKQTFYSGLTSEESTTSSASNAVEARTAMETEGGTGNDGTGFKYRGDSKAAVQNSSGQHSSGDSTAFTRTDSTTWSLRVQLLFALVSALTCLYEANTEYTEQYGPLNTLTQSVADMKLPTGKKRAGSPKRGSRSKTADTDGAVNIKAVWKERLFGNAWEMMQLISRLPHNTHAISRVLRTDRPNSSSSSGEVQQVRLGYAVFLSASSINHSCQPNASIRYTTATNGTTETTHRSGAQQEQHLQDQHLAASVLNYLRGVQIEIVSTASIAGYRPSQLAVGISHRGGGAYEVSGEVTVSYGPLHGPHSVEQRQDVLRQQYLFTCTCTACVNDLGAILQRKLGEKRQHDAQRAAHASDVLSGISTSGKPGLHTIDAIQRTPLGVVQSLTHAAAQHAQQSAQPAHDVPHLRQCVDAVKAELLQLNRLFSEVLNQARKQRLPGQEHDIALLQAFESKKLGPVNDKLTSIRDTYFPTSKAAMEAYARFDSVEDTTTRDECASDPLYADYCSAYCNYLDMRAHILALCEAHAQAALLVNTSIITFLRSGLYAANDVVIGRERVKLAGLLASMGDKRGAAAQAKCALQILLPVVSADDPDVTEGKCIYAYCRK